jgi:hypothetical protein
VRPEEVSEVQLQADEVEQAPIGFELDQEVDVALRPSLPRATEPKTRTLLAP